MSVLTINPSSQPQFVTPSNIDEVKKGIIDLMTCANDILRIGIDSSKLLPNLAIFRLKHLISDTDLLSSSYKTTAQKVSDTFLICIDAKSLSEWVAKPLAEGSEIANPKDIHEEIKTQTCLVFQEALPCIYERLLKVYQETLNRSISTPEDFQVIFQRFSRRLVQLIPALGEIQEFLISSSQPCTGCDDEKPLSQDFISLANNTYMLLRQRRLALFNQETNQINEVCFSLRKRWVALERSLIEQAKLPIPEISRFVDPLLHSDPRQVTEGWHQLLTGNSYDFKIRGPSLSHVQINVTFCNLFKNKNRFDFHAPVPQSDNLKHFKILRQKTFPAINFSNNDSLLEFAFPAGAVYNCMSFGVGRKASSPIPPAGKEPTPHRLWDVVQQLKDCGCIHVEELAIPLTLEPSSQQPTYLAAFVHDSGGGASGNADCHVYRCFFDPINETPIWMELLKEGGIKFATKSGDNQTLIRGIPHNPWEWFCKGSWNTFVGYWLVPPEAIFVIKRVMEENSPPFYREEEASIVT